MLRSFTMLRMEGLHSAEWPFAATTTTGMKQVQSWRCQMMYLSPSEQLLKDWNFLLSSPEGVGSIFLMVIILLLAIRVLGVELWHWLKGTRVSYFLTYGKLRCDGRAFRTRNARAGYVIDDGTLIEISRGLFRRRSAIYGFDTGNWEIVRDAYLNGAVPPGDYVWLGDRESLSVETALRLINTYPSLQAMLDRIDELEKDLSETRESFLNLHADIEAIIKLVKTDKQGYRAPAAQRMQYCLEQVCLRSKAPRPNQAMVDYGVAFYKERLKLL